MPHLVLKTSQNTELTTTTRYLPLNQSHISSSIERRSDDCWDVGVRADDAITTIPQKYSHAQVGEEEEDMTPPTISYLSGPSSEKLPLRSHQHETYQHQTYQHDSNHCNYDSVEVEDSSSEPSISSGQRLKLSNSTKPQQNDGHGSKDVLFGRGQGPARHVGNQAFRHFISMYKDGYNVLTKQSLQKSGKCKNKSDVYQPVTKSSFVEQIYRSWTGMSGRFVKLSDSSHDGEGGNNVWVEVAKNEVLKRIKTSLRETFLLNPENISNEAKEIAREAQNLMPVDYEQFSDQRLKRSFNYATLVPKPSQTDVLRTRSPTVYESIERSEGGLGVSAIPDGNSYQENMTPPSNLSGPSTKNLPLNHQHRAYLHSNKCDPVVKPISGQRLKLNTYSNLATPQNGGHGSKDVIFGRGQGPTMYVGNQAFRHFISLYKDSCGVSTKQSLPQSKKCMNKCEVYAAKLLLAERIYRLWMSMSGRFLKPLDLPHAVDGEQSHLWVDVAKSEVVKKIVVYMRQRYLLKPENISNEARAIASEAQNLMSRMF